MSNLLNVVLLIAAGIVLVLMYIKLKKENVVPPGFEPGLQDSKSHVLTNYTIGHLILFYFILF